MKKYIKATSQREPLSFSKKYSIRENFPFDLDDHKDASDEELIEIMQDNGYGYAPTLGEACEMYFDDNEDVDEALAAIETDYGNEVGVFPLSIFDYDKQQEIYLTWMKTSHPDLLEGYEY